jgi:hypothetical protein
MNSSDITILGLIGRVLVLGLSYAHEMEYNLGLRCESMVKGHEIQLAMLMIC